MRMAVGSDERTQVTDAIVDNLRRVGVEVELRGPLDDKAPDWVDIGHEVGERVFAERRRYLRPGPTPATWC